MFETCLRIRFLWGRPSSALPRAHNPITYCRIESFADAPVCATDKLAIVGAFRGEHLKVLCEVQADPPARSFKWKFNSSGESYDIGKDRYAKNGSRSELHYTPVTDQDYGTLTCAGTNEVGEQKQPCTFQIVLAGNAASASSKKSSATLNTELPLQVYRRPSETVR